MNARAQSPGRPFINPLHRPHWSSSSSSSSTLSTLGSYLIFFWTFHSSTLQPRTDITKPHPTIQCNREKETASLKPADSASSVGKYAVLSLAIVSGTWKKIIHFYANFTFKSVKQFLRITLHSQFCKVLNRIFHTFFLILFYCQVFSLYFKYLLSV